MYLKKISTRLVIVLLGGALLAEACGPVVSEEQRKVARVHYDLGVAAMQQGNINEATRELIVANKNDGRMPEVHNALGLAYHAKKQTDKAITHYKKALELRGDFSECRNNYAVLLMDIGHYNEAAKEFQAIMEDVMYPTPHFAEANLGWISYKLGDYEAAIAHLRNALATDNKFCRGYLWLATVYDAAQKLDNALSQMDLFFTRCIEDRTIRTSINNEFIAEANKQMGILLIKNGQEEKARTYLQNCATEELANGVPNGFCSKALLNL